MKLWLIKPNENLPKDDNPWEPWYDKAHKFVVRAGSERIARQLAHDMGGDENIGRAPWLDEEYSTCEELTEEGSSEVVIGDFTAG